MRSDFRMRRGRVGLVAVIGLAVLAACGNPANSVGGPVESPEISAIGGFHQSVTIQCATADAVIHYTMDGSAPNAESPVYTAALSVSGVGVKKNIKAIAILDGTSSDVVSETVTAGLPGSSGVVYQTVSTSACLSSAATLLSDLAYDGSYNLYISRDNQIFIIDTVIDEISDFAGSSDTGTADGIGAAARFDSPQEMTCDGTYLYVYDSGNNTIRRVTLATKQVTTLAGTPGISGVLGSAPPATSFTSVAGLTTDGLLLYLIDSGYVRTVDPSSGVITTMSGLIDEFVNADSMVYDPCGALFVVSDNSVYKYDLANGAVSVQAGPAYPLTQSASGATDDTGSAARFDGPIDIATDGSSLYVTDIDNNKVRKIGIASQAATSFTGVASTASSGSTSDGSLADAHFITPRAIAFTGYSFYVSQSMNPQLRIIH